MEMVISAHKSVAELGVIGRAEDMHQIMDAERDATLAYLDRVTRQMGGRRGQAAMATPTGGLIYAHTRHATSRAGDPCPHDHVLVANLVEMNDEQGGWKAADTALWREHLHAATMVGRVAAARVAVELGYGIEADPGPSGKLGHWRIAGVPDEVMEVHSKRAAEIEAECERRGDTSYQARGGRRPHHPQGQTARARGRSGEPLAGRAGRGRLAGRAAGRLDRRRRQPGSGQPLSVDRTPAPCCPRSWDRTAIWPAGRCSPAAMWSWRWPRTCTASTPSARAPGRPGAGRPRSRPPGRRGRRPPTEPTPWRPSWPGRPPSPRACPASWTAPTPPPCPARTVEAAIAKTEQELGGRLSAEQRAAAVAICTSGRGAELVVGVAGSGKTTMLRAVAAAFEASGYQVVGTATSGQAARNLGQEAELGESRTLASLIWRLDHGQLELDDRSRSSSWTRWA